MGTRYKVIMISTQYTLKKALIESFKQGNYIVGACEQTGVARKTFYNWIARDKRFAAEYEKARESNIRVVEDALTKRAVGYEYDEVTKEDGAEVKRVTKQIAPDTTAQIFYLCNRSRDKWQNVNKVEVTGKGGQLLNVALVSYASPVVPDKGQKE